MRRGMSSSATPHDDLRNLIETVPPLPCAPVEAIEAASADASLGGLSTHLARVATAQGRATPRMTQPLVAVFAGAHAVAGEGASAHARARVDALTRGISPLRGIAAEAGAAFKIYEFGIEHPCADMCEGPSLTPRETAAAFAFGMEVVAEGADVIALGSVGAGTSAAAAAIACALYGGASADWASGPNGSDVQAALSANAKALGDPLETLSAFGGRDLAGLAGAITAARYQNIPVILDGFATCAAAAVLYAVAPDSLAHCIAGHRSAEFAQHALLDRLGLSPVVDFGIGVGDGTGAALALGSLKSAAAGLAISTTAPSATASS